MFSQEQNSYKSHTYVHISCNRALFDLKDPLLCCMDLRVQPTLRFFSLLFVTINEFVGSSSFKTVLYCKICSCLLIVAFTLGTLGLYSAVKIIVFILITLCFLTLASVLVIFPTFSSVRFTFFYLKIFVLLLFIWRSE